MIGGTFCDSCFDQPLCGADWPASLRRLIIGHDFQQSLQGLGSWIPHLKELYLLVGIDTTYNSLLSGIEWPSDLRKLYLFEDAKYKKKLGIPPSVKKVYLARGAMQDLF